jgi:hypothetical protein
MGMENSPKTEQNRGKPHRFKPGVKPGPGRPKGKKSASTVLLRAILEDEGEEIIRKVIDNAKDGDSVCMKLCVERLIPVAREREVRLELPKIETAEDVTKAIASVLTALAEGQITPNEGQSIAALLETHRKALETLQFEKRIEALEAQANES